MKTLFLLVLLTRNDAGDINASFVNTNTLAQCRQKEALVEGVFDADERGHMPNYPGSIRKIVRVQRVPLDFRRGEGN